jgi:hypothetical protein
MPLKMPSRILGEGDKMELQSRTGMQVALQLRACTAMRVVAVGARAVLSHFLSNCYMYWKKSQVGWGSCVLLVLGTVTAAAAAGFTITVLRPWLDPLVRRRWAVVPHRARAARADSETVALLQLFPFRFSEISA